MLLEFGGAPCDGGGGPLKTAPAAENPGGIFIPPGGKGGPPFGGKEGPPELGKRYVKFSWVPIGDRCLPGGPPATAPLGGNGGAPGGIAKPPGPGGKGGRAKGVILYDEERVAIVWDSRPPKPGGGIGPPKPIGGPPKPGGGGPRNPGGGPPRCCGPNPNPPGGGPPLSYADVIWSMILCALSCPRAVFHEKLVFIKGRDMETKSQA